MAAGGAIARRGYGTALVLPRTWKSAHRAGAGRHPGTGRLRRRSPIRADQPDGAGARRPCPASSTRTPHWRCRTGRRCRRNGRCRSLACPLRKSSRWRQANGLGTGPRGGAGAGLGRRLQALDLLSGGRAASGRTGARCLGGRRPRRKGACRGDRGRGRTRVRDLTGTDLRNGILAMAAAERRDLEQFRPDAYRRRARHADHGHFRPHQPLSLGAAERSCGDGVRPRPRCRASPATARSAP